jgi:predicted acyltransferase
VNKELHVDKDLTSSVAQPPAANMDVSQRVASLDALRGFDMFWIVGGQELAVAVAKYFSDPPAPAVLYQLEHPAWLGFSAWDLIMPLFLFVVGAAMPFSFSRRLERGDSQRELYLKMIRRVAILFVLGMIAQGNLLDFQLSTLHVFSNTLQSIAVGYLVAGVVMINVGIVGQLLFTAAMLVGYWLLMMYVPFAGHAAGTLEPQANLALVVDEFVLGQFRDGTTYTWVLSGMGFAATTLLGVQAGHLLRSPMAPFLKLLALTGAGLFCLAGGWAWAEWLHFPIIKHIWTSSMALWAAGWSFLLLALFYLLIDVAGWRRWAFPFIVYGANAITIYVVTHIFSLTTFSERLVGGLAAHFGAAGPVLIAFTAVLLGWLLVYHLYRQKIFLRV